MKSKFVILIALCTSIGFASSPRPAAAEPLEEITFRRLQASTMTEDEAVQGLHLLVVKLCAEKKHDRAQQILAEAEKVVKEEWSFVIIDFAKALVLQSKGNVTDAIALMEQTAVRMDKLPQQFMPRDWNDRQFSKVILREWRDAKLRQRSIDPENVVLKYTLPTAESGTLTVKFNFGSVKDRDVPQLDNAAFETPPPPVGETPVTLQHTLSSKGGAKINVAVDWSAGDQREVQQVKVTGPRPKPAPAEPDKDIEQTYILATDQGIDLVLLMVWKGDQVVRVAIEPVIDFLSAVKP